MTLAPPTAPGSSHSRFCDVGPLRKGRNLLALETPYSGARGNAILARLLPQPRERPWTRYPGGARESGNRLTPAHSEQPVRL